MRIGILGGTFDPPHIGHLQLAEAAHQELELDMVMMIPAAKSPFKVGRKETAPKKRLEMVRLMAEDFPFISVSDIEITRGGPSYMFQTVDELQKTIPADYWLIMGADHLAGFMTWMHADRILRTVRLAAAPRLGLDLEALAERLSPAMIQKLDLLKMEEEEISSTEIRELVKRGRIPAEWLHPKVAAYIETNGLYNQQ